MADLQGALLGCGNPLLDISSEVPMDILKKYDVTLNNAILAEEKHMPLYKELIADFPVQYIAGGATQNSIRVAQWMLGTAGCTAYMGCIGNDDYGEQLQKKASEDGVLVHYQRTTESPTGTCAVLVNGGERSLVANIGAANNFTVSHLETETSQEIINRAKVVYIAGFFLTVSIDSILKIATSAVENNKIFTMNLSAPFLIDFFGDQMAAAMPFCDIVFGNESEAAAYGKAKGYGDNLETIGLKLAAQPKASGTRARMVVFTQGSDCTMVIQDGVVKKYDVEKLPKELLVDTNGAGDAFVGGFLSQLLKSKPVEECVRAGHFAARTIIQRSGCTFPAECEYV